LASDVAVALIHEAPGVFFHLRGTATGGVAVDGSRFAAAPAEQLVQRHAGELPLYVPQGEVDAGERVVEDGARSPIAAHIRRLVDVFDVGGVASLDERGEILLDRLDDRVRPLRERGAAEAEQVRLGRFDLDYN
jgi:hypothetical protein